MIDGTHVGEEDFFSEGGLTGIRILFLDATRDAYFRGCYLF